MAEAQGVVRTMLLQSPPGELATVAQDITTLLGSSAAVDAVAADAYREYNLAQMVVADVPGSSDKVLICKHGEVAPGAFLDPRRGTVCTFDHLQGVVTAVRPATAEEQPPAGAEPYRASLEAALLAYVGDKYKPNGECAVFALPPSGGGALSFAACVSSAQFNGRNFWNGRVRSEWLVDVTPGEEAVALRGRLQVSVHYFEEGNVQLNTAHECTAEASAADAGAFGAAAVAALSKAEGEYYGRLEETFDTMNEGTFKELRRMLPVTRAKFPWEQVQHKLAVELATKEKAAKAAAAGQS